MESGHNNSSRVGRAKSRRPTDGKGRRSGRSTGPAAEPASDGTESNPYGNEPAVTDGADPLRESKIGAQDESRGNREDSYWQNQNASGTGQEDAAKPVRGAARVKPSSKVKKRA